MKKGIVLCLVAVLVIVDVWGFLTDNCAAEERGKSIYDSKCAICHGEDGKGEGPAAASLSPSPKDFNTASFWQNVNDEKIRETVENGHGPMPAFQLSSSEISAVISYMKQAFKP